MFLLVSSSYVFVSIIIIVVLGMWSTSGDAWCLHGIGGTLTALSGKWCIMLLSREFVEGIGDLENFMYRFKKGDPAFDATNTAVVLEKGRGVWVPFGSLAVGMALVPNRPTATSVAASKKTSGKTYQTLMFLPCYSTKNDTAAKLENRLWVCSYMKANQRYLPKKFLEGCTEHADWVKALTDSTEKASVDDIENVAEQKRRDSRDKERRLKEQHSLGG